MIVQKDFLSKIKDFGLNSYEAKLWTALLSRGVSTAGELSEISNVPRSRTYDVLESLEKKGFIVMKLGKPIKYIAVHPEEVVERVKKRFREDAEISVKMLDDMKKTEVLNELKLLHKQGIEFIDPTDITGCIKGRDNIYDHLTFMVKNAEKSIVIAASSKGIMRKFEFLKKHLEKAKQKGVSIRIATDITKENSQIINKLKEVAEVKNVDKLTSRFCIVDGKNMMFMMHEDDKVHPRYDTGVWVSTPLFAASVEQMFNKM